MRVGRTRLSTEDAWLLLHVYRQDAVIYFDFNGRFPPAATLPDDELTLVDLGRIVALGVRVDSALTSKAFAAAVSARWDSVPHELHLRHADPLASPELLARIAELYEHFRYKHGLGAELALAILHLRRPFLVPLFTAPLFSLYSMRASEIAGEFNSSTPMFWESIRRDIVENTTEMSEIRTRLATDADVYSQSLVLLSDVRLHCIIAQQYVESTGR